MIVFEKNKPRKSDYRRFKIKKVKGQDDVASLKEVLFRRLKHKEWPLPDLILLDGGRAQLKAAKRINLPVIALAKGKDKTGGKIYTPFSKKSLSLKDLPENLRNVLIQIQAEAHCFAISYHKKRRRELLPLRNFQF